MTSANIYGLVQKITPIDVLEETHIQDTLIWIQSGGALYRITKPDVLNTHLVSYCVVYFFVILVLDMRI